jgi:hypothetical protein
MTRKKIVRNSFQKSSTHTFISTIRYISILIFFKSFFFCRRRRRRRRFIF